MFPNLVDLHLKNGLDLGNTYKTDNACRTFVQAIGQSMKDDLVEKLKNTRFFSVMSDSSIDRSVKDQEMVYMTYVEDGKPVNHFVDIVSLEHAHSQGILDAILVGLRNVGLTEQDLKSRMVGFGCDGASVMMGVHNGVAAKLKQLCPSLVPIWCVAHRLELSALDSIKSVPLLAELKETLNGVYKHYSHSAKASRELHALGKAMGIDVVKPGNIDGTRWLPHMSRALEGLVKNFKVTLVHFENHASDPNDREASAVMKGRARSIHRSLTQYKMVMFIHLLLDILQELKQLSLLFQRDGLTLQMVSDGLQTTTLSLVAMQTDPGPRLQKVLDEIGPGNTWWQNVQLNRSEMDNSTFNSLKLRLINDLCRFLSARFGNLETGILKATSTLFDLSNWPEDTAELATFGNAELIELMEHFQSILAACGDFTSVAAAKREWLDLKVLVQRHYRHLEPQVLWQRLLQGAVGREDQFEHMKVIVEITQVFPMSSSCCERGFSSMKRIKSDWRSCLSNEMLSFLLHISVHGPPAQQFNAEKAVTKWWSSGCRTRRPQFQD
ncbi:zinc finger protein 862-like [Centroberyx gerrardi]|uniref:zinc finger protein 862-like n=1 Tax=Centroberyx gerrardi TaxID=166262 RepID=UPI003AB05AD3